MKTSSGEHTLRRIYESIGHDLDLDLVMSNDLIGGALAQVAACSNLATLFDALLIDDETYEVYLRDGTSALGRRTRARARRRLGGRFANARESKASSRSGFSRGTATWCYPPRRRTSSR